MNRCIVCAGSFRNSSASTVSMKKNFICKNCGKQVLQERIKECEKDLKIQEVLIKLDKKDLTYLIKHNCTFCSGTFYHSLETKQDRCPICRLDNNISLLAIDNGIKSNN